MRSNGAFQRFVEYGAKHIMVESSVSAKVVSDLVRGFAKAEVMSVAEEMELGLPMEMNSRKMIEAICADIDANGVPDPKTCSTTMMEFLVAAEIITETGDVIIEEEHVKEVAVKAVKAVVKTVDEVDMKLPECYGYEDDRDPACISCRVQDACKAERIKNRPACFGKIYDKNDVDCQGCLEAAECALLVNMK